MQCHCKGSAANTEFVLLSQRSSSAFLLGCGHFLPSRQAKFILKRHRASSSLNTGATNKTSQYKNYTRCSGEGESNAPKMFGYFPKNKVVKEICGVLPGFASLIHSAFNPIFIGGHWASMILVVGNGERTLMVMDWLGGMNCAWSLESRFVLNIPTILQRSYDFCFTYGDQVN